MVRVLVQGQVVRLHKIHSTFYAVSVEAVEAELRARMQAELGTAPDHGPAVHVVVVGGPGVKMTLMPLWAGGSEPVTRAAVPL